MSEQPLSQVQPNLVPEGFKTWNAYWKNEHNQSWRTEPEIDKERQQYLTEQRSRVNTAGRPVASPFKDVCLVRADVEWCLAIPGVGDSQSSIKSGEPIAAPVYSSVLDISHADLKGANLTNLPLDGIKATGVCLEGAQLSGASLQIASLYGANLRRADLSNAHLEATTMFGVLAEGASFRDTHLEGANLQNAHLERADFAHAHLEAADLSRAHFDQALLQTTHLDGAIITNASFRGALMEAVTLHGAMCSNEPSGAGDYATTLVLSAQLAARVTGNESYSLEDISYEPGTHFEAAYLVNAHLEERRVSPEELARIRPWAKNTYKNGEDFPEILPAADLSMAFFDAATTMTGTTLGTTNSAVSVADTRWGDTNLATIDWANIRLLGDELRARLFSDMQNANWDSNAKKSEEIRLWRKAVRANRQLAGALRDQGLNEEADRFSFRAQSLQRLVLRRERHLLRYLGSWVLAATSGYGYKPIRSLIAYVLIICLFTGAYLINAQFAAPHLTWDEALILSISAFHGRGFFTSGISLGDTLARLAAGEAIIGLLIEITFIATFTQRFFAR